MWINIKGYNISVVIFENTYNCLKEEWYHCFGGVMTYVDTKGEHVKSISLKSFYTL